MVFLMGTSLQPIQGCKSSQQRLLEVPNWRWSWCDYYPNPPMSDISVALTTNCQGGLSLSLILSGIPSCDPACWLVPTAYCVTSNDCLSTWVPVSIVMKLHKFCFLIDAGYSDIQHLIMNGNLSVHLMCFFHVSFFSIVFLISTQCDIVSLVVDMQYWKRMTTTTPRMTKVNMVERHSSLMRLAGVTHKCSDTRHLYFNYNLSKLTCLIAAKQPFKVQNKADWQKHIITHF